MALNIHEKGFTIFKNQSSWQKVKNMNHFVFLSFHFGTNNGSPGLGMANSLVVCRVSPGRIIVVLFWTKYAVPRQIKPWILKLTTSRGQKNLCTTFIFVSREEKGFYRIVSLGNQNLDCRSYYGLSHRTQGETCSLGLLCTSLILDIHVMIKKGNCWPVSCNHIAGSSLQLIEVKCFFKVDRWPSAGFLIGSRAHFWLTCWKQGRIVWKPINANPGLKVNQIITFSSFQMFLLLCFVHMVIIETQKAKQYTENLSAKLQTQIKILLFPGLALREGFTVLRMCCSSSFRINHTGRREIGDCRASWQSVEIHRKIWSCSTVILDIR